MPIRNFLLPDGEPCGLAEAPLVFEEAGVMPAEAVSALVAQEATRYEEHSLISPSKINPHVTCRRQVLIEHFLAYDLSPLILWDALEGTLWHRVFRVAGEAQAQELRELSLPRPEDEGRPGVKRVEGVLAMEVYPGIWMRGTLDRVREDLTVLVDHKTNRYPKVCGNNPPKDFGEKQRVEWAPQINTYSFMVEQLLGQRPQELWAWRTYRGSRRRDLTFRKLPIPLMTREEVLRECGAFMESLRDLQAECIRIRDGVDSPEAAQAALEAFIGTVPMDGRDRHMFNDQKCDLYCPVQRVCFGMEGLLVF